MRHGTLLAMDNAGQKRSALGSQKLALAGASDACVIDALSAVGAHRSQLCLKLEQQLNV